MMSLKKKKRRSVVYWRILIIFDGVNSFLYALFLNNSLRVYLKKIKNNKFFYESLYILYLSKL